MYIYIYIYISILGHTPFSLPPSPVPLPFCLFARPSSFPGCLADVPQIKKAMHISISLSLYIYIY